MGLRMRRGNDARRLADAQEMREVGLRWAHVAAKQVLEPRLVVAREFRRHEGRKLRIVAQLQQLGAGAGAHRNVAVLIDRDLLRQLGEAVPDAEELEGAQPGILRELIESGRRCALGAYDGVEAR